MGEKDLVIFICNKVVQDDFLTYADNVTLHNKKKVYIRFAATNPYSDRT